MNPSTHTSNSTAASPITLLPTAASPAKTPTDIRIEQREAPADAIKDKEPGALKRLGQPWKNMFNLKAQLHRHPLAAVLSGCAVLLGVGGGITIGVLENQRRKSFSYRFKKGFWQAKNRLFSPLH